MSLNIELIKELRAKTGVGMVDAKKVLEEADGNIVKAIELLRKQGAIKAQKKGDRVTKEGLISVYLHGNGRVGVMVEVNCETDFVARNDNFKNFVYDLAMHVAATDPQYLSKDDVPTEVIAKEEDIAREQLKQEGKDDNIIIKALPGRIAKFYSDNCLLEQIFIKDDKITIQDLLNQQIATLGENIKISRFARFSL